MSHLDIAIVAFKSLTLVMGGLVTFFSYRAFSRTGSPALRALAIGFGIVTAGAFLGGVLHQLTSIGFETSVLVQTVLTTIGFGVIVYSLYAK